MYNLRMNKGKRSIQKLEDHIACFWYFHHYYFSMAMSLKVRCHLQRAIYTLYYTA